MENVSAKSFQQFEGEGILNCNLQELHKEIDKGWRYFWKKRGLEEPPCAWGGAHWWEKRNREKDKIKAGKQKAAKRMERLQRENPDFFRE